MDSPQEGILLIASTMIVLVAFSISVLVFMLIYRKRKLQFEQDKARHKQEIELMQERFEKELLETKLEVKNQTMKYISQEIHDNIKQKLTLGKIITQQVKPEEPESTTRKVNDIAQIIDMSLKELRNLSTSLNSDLLAQADLLELISNECSQIRKANLVVMLSAKVRKIECPDPVKLIAFRIFQEFTQNSLRHSRCNTIFVRINQAPDDSFSIIVRDKGIGFNLPAIRQNPGSGLDNMNKRAKFISAHLYITSIEGKGTLMKLSIPSKHMKNNHA